MSNTVRVEVEQDHLERLVKQPVVGIAELIWNALDADATTVNVSVERNDAGGPETLLVVDDGKGITPERADLSFGRLGGSWKKTTATTDAGRALHGRLGQGRWAAYGLGEIVRWESVADRVSGERTRIAIAGKRGALREFVVSDPVVVSDGTATGTTVRVENLAGAAVKALNKPTVAADLTAQFALYLKRYPVSIGWMGEVLDPSSLQKAATEHVLSVKGVDEPLQLTIIEWTTNVERALHLCDEGGFALTQLAPGIQAPGFEFTAYLSWKGFRDHIEDLALGDMASEPIPAVLEAAKDAMRLHFKERLSQRGRELIRTWVADMSWPYKVEPKGELEKAEREVFEVVAVAAAPVVESADTKTRALTLRLLKEAVETSPGTVHDVLEEVLSLPKERVDELRDLLQRTTLSAIITSARAITDRLDFIDGLEALVFDKDLKKHVKERSQLHRILANEAWLFREEYVLTVDDNTLLTALKAHIGILGRADLAPEDLADEVLDAAGKRMVVDLMLSRAIEQTENKRHNIVIELKRPSVNVGMTEFAQIQKYATAVMADDRFAHLDAQWEFWIVGNHLEPEVESMANQKNREPGIVNDGDHYVVRAVTWASIIENARHRLKFVRKSLDYATSTDSGLAYLRRVHSDRLPPQASDKASGVSPADVEALAEQESAPTQLTKARPTRGVIRQVTS